MSSVSDGIKGLLVTAGVGTFGASTGWSIGIGKTVSEPDTFVLIKELPGQPPNPAWLLDYPSVQVLVRGNEKGWSAAHDKAVAVKNALLGLPSQTIGGDRWVSITMATDIADLGVDDKKRPLFSLNFHLIIEPAASASSYRQSL